MKAVEPLVDIIEGVSFASHRSLGFTLVPGVVVLNFSETLVTLVE